MKTGRRRGRGESAIYEKTRRWKSGKSFKERTYWVAVVSEGHDEAGRRRRKMLYAHSQKEAQDALFAYLVRRGGSPSPRARAATVAEFAGVFLEDARANLAPNTARSYEGTLTRYVLPTIGAKRLDELDSGDIQHLYRELRKKGISASLLARTHVTLRRLINVAKKRRLIKTSPLEEIEVPRYKRPPAKTLTVKQLKKLFVAAKGNRLEALFVLAATTGMRQGELFALRWDAVDLVRRTLSVTHSVEEIDGALRVVQPKSATSQRRIELSKVAVDALRRRRAIASREGHRSAYVFPSPSGGLMRKSNFLRRVYFPLRDDAKLPKDIPFHALRHTSASLLLLKGISPRVVQEMLGHADVRLTLSTYSHVLPTLQRQAANALDSLFRRRRTS